VAEALVLTSAPALDPGSCSLAGGVTLHVPPPRAFVRLQIARRFVGSAGLISVGEITLPTAANRCHGNDPAALWTAPDGWLLTSQRLNGPSLRELAGAAAGERTAAAIDVSDALVALELSGTRARAVLARGTGIDLSSDAFGPGQCIRTRLAQLAVILRPCTGDSIELIVDRSPAAWLCEWLVDAAQTFRGEPER
jgi:sarcosine oxidase subunit gamma